MSKGVYIFQGGTDTMISMMKDELLKMVLIFKCRRE